MSEHPEALIDAIEAIRTVNNLNWMGILRIAVRADPKAAKALLSEINKNDSAITRLLGDLCKSMDDPSSGDKGPTASQK